MQSRSLVAPASSLLVALACLTTACAPPPQAAASPALAAPPPPRERHVYRFEFTVTESEPGKAAVVSNHLVNIEEGGAGELRLGANVPLQTNGGSVVARQDLGMKLHASYTLQGEDLLVHASLEMSSNDGGTILRTSMNGDAVVSAGKPMVVASGEDRVTHRRTELKVVATKIR